MKTVESLNEEFPWASQSHCLPYSNHVCFKCIVHLHFALGMPEFHIFMLGFFLPAAPTEVAPVPWSFSTQCTKSNLFLPLQNSSVIKLYSSEKESWLGSISENPHSYCNHFLLPKGNPRNGNFHSWRPFLTSFCFLLPWLTNNDLVCRRWEYLETTLSNDYRTSLWMQTSDLYLLTKEYYCANVCPDPWSPSGTLLREATEAAGTLVVAWSLAWIGRSNLVNS